MAQISITSGAEVPEVASATEATPALNVGTRQSRLALKQTDLVIEALEATHTKHTFAVKSRNTAAGDIDKVTPFKDMAVKNLWTHELETLMTEGSLDFLVHSLKDVPTQLPAGCEISCTLERGDPRDALVVKKGHPWRTIADLPAGSVIGTSSIRRTAQMALRYPQLVIRDLRGNVPTRLDKLDAPDGPYDAIIIAAAGLHRLDLGDRVTQYLDFKSAQWLYAVGQGAIGVESRSDDRHVKALLETVNHAPTFLATAAERSLLRTLEGGCSAPLGVQTEWLWDSGTPSTLRLQAIVVSVNGQESAAIDVTQKIESSAEAETYGISAAQALIQKGAGKILAEIQAKKQTTAADLGES